MNLNATLFAQFVVFFIFAGFTAKFVWPPLRSALDERAKKIAEGLAAADKSKSDLAAAEKRVQAELSSAREESQKRVSDAEKRAQQIVEDAKKTASQEAERIITNAKSEAERQVALVRDALRGEVAALAVRGSEQILKREINEAAHAELLNRLKAEL